MSMGPYTLSFGEVDGTRLPEVGGKGANLGELTRAGFPVPAGFCVTTAAYREFVRASGELDALLDSLERVTHEDLDTCGETLPGSTAAILRPAERRRSAPRCVSSNASGRRVAAP